MLTNFDQHDLQWHQRFYDTSGITITALWQSEFRHQRLFDTFRILLQLFL